MDGVEIAASVDLRRLNRWLVASFKSTFNSGGILRYLGDKNHKIEGIRIWKLDFWIIPKELLPIELIYSIYSDVETLPDSLTQAFTVFRKHVIQMWHNKFISRRLRCADEYYYK